MKTEEFIAALTRSPEKQLIFQDTQEHAVQPGYHLTELKAAHFDTVDCGGQVNQWEETIVQLWVPEDADQQDMTARKFLKILDKVRGLIPLQLDAEIRVEYGDDNFFPSTYHVSSVSENSDEIRVALQPPATTCKARDRRTTTPREKAEACCCAA
jgi:Family of unknown function (DUF6428)